MENLTTILAATSLLIKIAQSDDDFDSKELFIIKSILEKNFNVQENNLDDIINDAHDEIEHSTDIYEFGETLNNNLNKEEKIQFICSIFEIAFSDGKLHYIEDHNIKKIAYILNITNEELINSKIEMKKILL